MHLQLVPGSAFLYQKLRTPSNYQSVLLMQHPRLVRNVGLVFLRRVAVIMSPVQVWEKANASVVLSTDSCFFISVYVSFLLAMRRKVWIWSHGRE